MAEAPKGRAIGADDRGSERIRRGHEPRVVLSKAALGPPLEQGTSPRLGDVQADDGEPVK